MEQLNRIELRGYVGNVKINQIADNKVANFSLVTSYALLNNEGSPVIENTWLNVSAMESPKIACLDKIKRGTPVYVRGRLRVREYMDACGNERFLPEVQASVVNIVELGPTERLNTEL